MRESLVLSLAFAATLAGLACRSPGGEAVPTHSPLAQDQPVPTPTVAPLEYFLEVYLPEERSCLIDKFGWDGMLAAVEEASQSAHHVWLTNHWDLGLEISRCDVSTSVFEQGVSRFRAGALELRTPWGLGRIAVPNTEGEAHEILLNMPGELKGATKEEGSWGEFKIVAYGDSFALAGHSRLGSADLRNWTTADIIGHALRSRNAWEGDDSGTDGPVVWLVRTVSGNELQLLFGNAGSRVMFDFRAPSRPELEALVAAFVDSAPARDPASAHGHVKPDIWRPPPAPPTVTPRPQP